MIVKTRSGRANVQTVCRFVRDLQTPISGLYGVPVLVLKDV